MMTVQKSAESCRTDVWRLLGLAAKAGKIAAGSAAVEKAIRYKRAFLLLVAEDAAGNTAARYTKLAEHADVPCSHFGRKEEIGHWTGASVLAVLAITDQGFAARLQELIEKVNQLL